jgi:cell division protein FtsN
LLGVVGLIGIGLVVYFFSLGPKGEQETTPSRQQAEAPHRDGSSAEKPDLAEPSEPAPSSEPKSTAHQRQLFPGEGSNPPSRLPVITLPANADRLDLENLVFPPLPYCIYTGAYRDLQEADTTRSELDSNYLAAHIVPIEIEGNVAHSLFGVSTNGTWYGVMTGHFTSKEEARQTLGMMMNELPGYQPEILKFPYALECGRFLVTEEAHGLDKRLSQASFFPYAQVYPTSDGRTITRIMVGCFFSKAGAQAQNQHLEKAGFSCEVVER